MTFTQVLGPTVALAIAASGFAQSVLPVSDQFQVNSHTTGDQRLADVAIDGTGAFVVVWESLDSPGTDTSGSAIVARRFDSSGSPVDVDFQVNSHTTGDQIAPEIAMGSGGGFLVVWGGPAAASGDGFFSIQAQRFDTAGIPQDGELLVNSYTTNVQESPDVAVSGDGRFLVVWQSSGSFGPDSDGRSIQGQLYAPDGGPLGDQFQINTYSGSDQADPAIAAEPVPDGDFVVVWFNVAGNGAGDTSGRSVQGQVVGSNGELVGSEFQVNTYTEGNQYDPAIAVGAAGDFVVAWTSAGPFGTDDDLCVLGQRFDRDGLVIGDEFLVNSYTEGIQSMPSVAYAEAGGTVAAWRSGDSAGSGPDGDTLAVAGQAFEADGETAGPEFVANTYVTGAQWLPAIAAGPDRRYVVVWQSEGSPGDDPDLSIQARIFSGVIFADGFESGDTGQWTISAP